MNENKEVFDLIGRLIADGKRLLIFAQGHELRAELTEEVAHSLRKDKDVKLIGFAEQHTDLHDAEGVEYFGHFTDGCKEFLGGIEGNVTLESNEFLILDNYSSSGTKEVLDYLAKGNPGLITGIDIGFHRERLSIQDIVGRYVLPDDYENAGKNVDTVVDEVISKAIDVVLFVGRNTEVKMYEMDNWDKERSKLVPTDLGVSTRYYIGDDYERKSNEYIKRVDIVNVLTEQLDEVLAKGNQSEDAVKEEYKKLIELFKYDVSGVVK